MIPTKKPLSNNLQPESNLWEQFSLQSLKGKGAAHNRKITNNFCLKLGISISLATAINLPGLERVAQAADLDSLQATNSQRTSNQSFLSTQGKVSSFLPRILSLLPFTSHSKITNSNLQSVDRDPLQSPNKATKQVNLPILKQQNQLANRQTSPAARSSVRQPLRIHRVQRGDSINKIAQTYRVSSQELIKLNRIKNSNIIFVGQVLKIPPTAIGGISLDPNQQSATRAIATDNSQVEGQNLPLASELSNSMESRKLEGTTNNQSPGLSRQELVATGEVEDPYLAGLRADIELMRARLREQNQAEADTARSINEYQDVTAPKLPKKSKIINSRASETNTKIDLPTLSSPLETNFFEEEDEIVALTLPPLPDSEEYLPSSFEGYIWPTQGILTSGYGWRWGRLHRGIDIAAPIGTPILAAAAGEVITVGWQNGYGNLVKLEHIDGSVTLYAHNNRNLVTHGQKVKQGEQIAEMGSTGYSTGPHLHFEIHTSDRKVINPLALLSER